MDRWNEASERYRPRRSDLWAERLRNYLRTRTADHWLMFAAGLLLGALLG